MDQGMTIDLMVDASFLIECVAQQEPDQLTTFQILYNNHLGYHI